MPGIAFSQWARATGSATTVPQCNNATMQQCHSANVIESQVGMCSRSKVSLGQFKSTKPGRFSHPWFNPDILKVSTEINLCDLWPIAYEEVSDQGPVWVLAVHLDVHWLVSTELINDQEGCKKVSLQLHQLSNLVGMSMAKACMVFIPGLARPVSACIWCSGVHCGVQHNLVWPCSELLVLTGVRSGIENAAQCPLWCRHGAN